MNENERHSIQLAITELGITQQQLALTMAAPTNESLQALTQAINKCNATIVKISPATLGKISIYWTSGVMTQMTTLSMYDAMPTVKLTMAQSLLPIINTHIANCINNLLTELALSPTTSAPIVGQSVNPSPVATTKPDDNKTNTATRQPETIALVSSAANDTAQPEDNVIDRLRALYIDNGVNIVDHILEYAPDLNNLLTEGALADEDGNDFIDFIESDHNVAFSDLESCLNELHTPDNLYLIEKNKSLVQNAERAVELWTAANDAMGIRNANVLENADDLAELFNMGIAYIENNAEYKRTHPKAKGIPSNIEQYVKEQTETLKRYFIAEVSDNGLLHELRAKVKWGADAEPARASSETKPPRSSAKEKTKSDKPHRMHIKLGVWLGMVGLLLVSITLCAMYTFGRDVLAAIGGILLFVTMVSYVVVIGMFFKHRREKVCPKCKKYYNFESDIGYELIDEIYKQIKVDPHKTGKQVCERLTYKFQIDCACHNCGHERSFNWKTPGGEAYTDGTTKYTNPTTTIRNYWSSPIIGTTKGENIFGFVLFGLGIAAAIIIAIMVGLKGESHLVPQNLRNTYYAINYNVDHCEITLGKNKCTIVQNNGFKTWTSEYKATYTKTENKEEILLENSEDKKVISIQGNELTMSYEYNSSQYATNGTTTLSTTDTTWAQFMHDPCNYYYTYRYSSTNEITFYDDGKARLLLNDETIYGTYIYATADWINANLKLSSGNKAPAKALVFYDKADGYYTYTVVSQSCIESSSGNKYYLVAGSETASASTNGGSGNSASGNDSNVQNGNTGGSSASTQPSNGSTDNTASGNNSNAQNGSTGETSASTQPSNGGSGNSNSENNSDSGTSQQSTDTHGSTNTNGSSSNPANDEQYLLLKINYYGNEYYANRNYGGEVLFRSSDMRLDLYRDYSYYLYSYIGAEEDVERGTWEKSGNTVTLINQNFRYNATFTDSTHLVITWYDEDDEELVITLVKQ